VRLAESETNVALMIPDDSERGKGESPTALHYLRGPVELDELLGKIVARLRVVSSVPVSFHETPPRK
ncbi:MAG: hypothetical protein FD137_879, partial [Spirochaetes bacterium]